MATHVKPSKEELQANIQKSLNDLENLPAEGQEPTEPPTPPVTLETPATEQPSESETTPEEPITPTEPPAAEPAVEAKSEIDWKKQYQDSSREARRVADQNKEIATAVEGAGNLSAPTDEEMKTLIPEWDELTVIDQRLLKDNELNKKRFDLIQQATSKNKASQAHLEKVNAFIGNPRTLNDNPQLEGKTDDFLFFATKPGRENMGMDDLVLAFLGEESKKVKNPHKGQSMFPSGTGGSKEAPKPKDDRLTVAEGAALLKSNPREWRRLSKLGKIRITDE